MMYSVKASWGTAGEERPPDRWDRLWVIGVILVLLAIVGSGAVR